MNITDFLLARIAEDEAAARAEDERLTAWYREYGGRAAIVITDWQIGPGDPARVLAECEAKRRIVRDYVHAGDCAELEAEGDRIDEAHDQWALEAALEISLRALASVYADHPDYDDNWRP